MRIRLVALLLVLSAGAGQLVSGASVAAARGSLSGGTRVALHVNAGWNNRYRAGGAWTPVRVSATNHSRSTLRGVLSVADTAGFSPSHLPLAYSSAYETPVTLLAGQTKNAVLSVPGTDIQGEIDVTLRVGTTALASASVFPTPFQDNDVTVGVITDDPASSTWLGAAGIPSATVDVVALDRQTLDETPLDLASFDVLVLTNIDLSHLMADQTDTLERYVRNGGTLLLVGGPDWQESIKPLPAVLVPGRIVASERLPNLNALTVLGSGSPPPSPTIVSKLLPQRGWVQVEQGGIPLLVRSPLGVGHLVYLGFDPAVSPLSGWRGLPALASRIIAASAPQALRRLSTPAGYGDMSFVNPGPAPLDIVTEMEGFSGAARTLLLLVMLLTVLTLLLVAPIPYVLLRRTRHVRVSWLAVPVLGLGLMNVPSGLAHHFAAAQIDLRTVGAVELDGSSDIYPENLFVGLFAPVRGSYTVQVDNPSLPVAVGPYHSLASSVAVEAPPLGWRFVEGSATQVQIVQAGSLTRRVFDLHTSVHITGSIRGDLQIDRVGDIVGSLHNTTTLRILHPVLIAGRSILHLSDLAPGAVTPVRIRPADNVRAHNYPSLLLTAYGQAPVVASQGLPEEHTLAAAIRGAASMLPESNSDSMLGQVQFLGWTTASLNPVTVNGASPTVQGLTLLAVPLSVQLSPGPFKLRPGTIGASLADVTSVRPTYACCGPTVEGLYLGVGGAATFELDVPRERSVHLRSLSLSVYAGGPDPSYTEYTDLPAGCGEAFDWRAQRWIPLIFRHATARLTEPARFVSPTGVLLLRLQATHRSGDLTIVDPHRDIQISGTGLVRW